MRWDGEPAHVDVFYTIEQVGGRHMADSTAMSLPDVYSELFAALEADGDFVGMRDATGAVLQILYEARGECYLFDMPVPERRGSFQRRLPFDEAADLVKHLRTPFDPRALRLHFAPW